MSTTPVREAMRDLASEGLISLHSHRIGTVRKPDWDEMTEIVVIRRALERSTIDRWMKYAHENGRSLPPLSQDRDSTRGRVG